MSGAAGSSSTGIQGGNGYKLTKRIFLHKGDRLEWSLGKKGSYCPNGTISRGGGMSVLKLNGSTVLIAGGGAGAVPVNDGTTTFVLQGGEGVPDGANGSVTYHTHSNNCYGYRGHDHTVNCASHTGFHSYANCGHCHHTPKCDHYMCEGYTAYDCGDDPKNTDWGLTCKKTNQTIDAIKQAKPGECFVTDDWDPTDASLSQSGAGEFSVRLVPCTNMYYHEIVAKYPKWQGYPVYLIILDDTVVYYKKTVE